MSPAQVDAGVVAYLFEQVATGDARVRGVTTTSWGLVLDADVTDEVLEQLTTKEKKS